MITALLILFLFVCLAGIDACIQILIHMYHDWKDEY